MLSKKKQIWNLHKSIYVYFTWYDTDFTGFYVSVPMKTINCNLYIYVHVAKTSQVDFHFVAEMFSIQYQATILNISTLTCMAKSSKKYPYPLWEGFFLESLCPPQPCWKFQHWVPITCSITPSPRQYYKLLSHWALSTLMSQQWLLPLL